MMVMGYLSAIVCDKEGAAECKAGAAGGGYHSACLTAYGARLSVLCDAATPSTADLDLMSTLLAFLLYLLVRNAA